MSEMKNKETDNLEMTKIQKLKITFAVPELGLSEEDFENGDRLSIQANTDHPTEFIVQRSYNVGQDQQLLPENVITTKDKLFSVVLGIYKFLVIKPSDATVSAEIKKFASAYAQSFKKTLE